MTPSLRLLPNVLSAGRLALGLGFPFLPPGWWFGAVVAAATTDALDGPLARRLGAESAAGRVLDPLADKLFVLAAVGTVLLWPFPAWAVAVVARDLVAGFGAAGSALRGRWVGMTPTRLGKATTVAQFTLLLAATATGEPWRPLLWLTAGLSIAAATDYARRSGMTNSHQ